MDTNIHTELLSRIRTAIDREWAISSGLAAQIVDATRLVSVRHAEEYQARRRLNAWPDDLRRAGMSPRELNDSLNAASDLRRAARATERLAGREAVQERTVRDLAAAAARAGADPAVAVQQFIAASATADHQAAQAAWERAVEARKRAEAQLTMLEQERSQHGRRGGQLRQTLQEAEAWMRANGIATEEALAA